MVMELLRQVSTIWFTIYENEMKYKNSIGTLLSNTKRFVLR